jgi:N-glycosylase/DNA lyase
MKIALGPSCPLDMDSTLCCGQTFRWDKRGEWWYGVVRDNVFKIRQTGHELESENVDVGFVKTYFGLRDDLPKILSLPIPRHLSWKSRAR